MSDERYSIKIQMEIKGQKFDLDASWNWFSLEENGVDEKLIGWLSGKYAEANAKQKLEDIMRSQH